jgi:hypothetical protein
MKVVIVILCDIGGKVLGDTGETEKLFSEGSLFLGFGKNLHLNLRPFFEVIGRIQDHNAVLNSTSVHHGLSLPFANFDLIITNSALEGNGRNNWVFLNNRASWPAS